MSVDGETLRAIMRRVASPVVVVTMAGRDESRGMTASSFTSVSLHPPLVSVGIGKGSRAHELMLQSEHFVINVLADDQADLADRFAEAGLSGSEQFATVPHEVDGYGVPALADALGWLHCRRHSVLEGGDHEIFLGEVVEARAGREGAPLLYYARTYHRVGDTTPR